MCGESGLLETDVAFGPTMSLCLHSPTCSSGWCGLHLSRGCSSKSRWGHGSRHEWWEGKVWWQQIGSLRTKMEEFHGQRKSQKSLVFTLFHGLVAYLFCDWQDLHLSRNCPLSSPPFKWILFTKTIIAMSIQSKQFLQSEHVFLSRIHIKTTLWASHQSTELQGSLQVSQLAGKWSVWNKKENSA